MATDRTNQLHDGIEDLILTGVFAPGCRLDEMSLASRFNVSRTPIREVLRSLAATGLIELRPYRGAVVTEIGPDRLAEMFETMAELEASCVRLAAERAAVTEIARIEACHAACASTVNAAEEDAYYYDNAAFHEAIYVASGNAFLAEQTRQLRRRVKPFRRLQLRVAGRIQRSYGEHDGIVDAIVDRRADEAAAQMRRHVMVQETEFGALIAEGLIGKAPQQRDATAG